ncbi:hypothetical protein [Chryseolinea lacunae]|uniref:Lipoprotein n=1 Tax=Chryseolinea lacunae TaxID=2801331 RepID=A0ABS1KRG0_9BACT|nr:hypothetical protein [Chryseolinea lacunae]MBL0742060.1 hypothetical protein [Chryseolinea lacunae]
MKNHKALLFLTVFAALTACNNDDDAPVNSITTDEAAVIVSSSLASNTSGVSFVSDKTTGVTEDLLKDNAGGRVNACGVSQNIAFSGSSPSGATVTFSYDFSYKFRLECNDQNAPSLVSVDLSYSGAFDGPKLKASHSGVSELDVTGLADTTKNFLLNGQYKRSGSFENKEQAKSGSSTVEITLTTLVVNKVTHKIVSGTGTYLIEGSVPSKGDFKYTGDITFQGNDAALLIVGGENFTLNLKNGEVSKKQS